MIYLRLADGGMHSRSALAALLWGDHTEERARHSLSQALGRIRTFLGAAALAFGDDAICWEGQLDCDAAWLEDAYNGATLDDALLHFYTGDFLTEFHLPNGAECFNEWAAERRVYYRTLAVRWLQRRAESSEAEGDWNEVLQCGLRAVAIEPIFETGHRSVMRSLSALGERSMALKHYHDFATWLRVEIDVTPDPATQDLAARLRNLR